MAFAPIIEDYRTHLTIVAENPDAQENPDVSDDAWIPEHLRDPDNSLMIEVVQDKLHMASTMLEEATLLLDELASRLPKSGS